MACVLNTLKHQLQRTRLLKNSVGARILPKRGIMHDPDRYEAFKSVARRDIEEAVPLLISKMSPWKKCELVLDYGCGAGSTGNKFFLPLAEESDSKIDAIDISTEMIQHAKANFASPRVTYYNGNLLADDFPLEGKAYDRIFSIYVFHYIQDYKAALKKFYELCKPGAEFGFTALARSNVYEYYKLVGEMEKFKKYMQGYENFIPAWYKEVPTADHALKCFTETVTALGFEILHSKIHYQGDRTEVDTMMELMLALNPFTKNIPEELAEEFRTAYRDAIIKRSKLAIGSTHVDTTREMLSFVVKRKN